MPGRFKAALLLVYAVIRTLLKRLFGRARVGLPEFEANYGDEGLLPLTPSERSEASGYGRCIACGLCDRGEGGRIAESRGGYQGVMHFVLVSSRSFPDYELAARSLRFLPRDLLEEKERRCPTAVPMRKLADLVERKSSFRHPEA